MGIWRSALLRRQIRFVLYVLIVLVLFLVRGPDDWRTLWTRLWARAPAEPALTVAGRDLAPPLVDALTTAYRRDYPEVSVTARPGGTTHALQALLNAQADVAVLARPPLESERHAFEAAHQAPPSCEPFSLGALVLVASSTSGLDSLTSGALAARLSGRSTEPARLICEDPNLGLWETFASLLGVEPAPATPPAGVYFVADTSALYHAVRGDLQAVGMTSSFFAPSHGPPEGLKLLAVRGPEAPRAVTPTYEAIAYGRYPLLHHLWLACRDGATGQAAKFVTFVLGGRGQRLVERAGYLPARQVLREIILDDAPLGAR
jgi:phosphate transport system substrate-binding protein